MSSKTLTFQPEYGKKHTMRIDSLDEHMVSRIKDGGCERAFSFSLCPEPTTPPTIFNVVTIDGQTKISAYDPSAYSAIWESKEVLTPENISGLLERENYRFLKNFWQRTLAKDLGNSEKLELLRTPESDDLVFTLKKRDKTAVEIESEPSDLIKTKDGNTFEFTRNQSTLELIGIAPQGFTSALKFKVTLDQDTTGDFPTGSENAPTPSTFHLFTRPDDLGTILLWDDSSDFTGVSVSKDTQKVLEENLIEHLESQHQSYLKQVLREMTKKQLDLGPRDAVKFTPTAEGDEECPTFTLSKA